MSETSGRDYVLHRARESGVALIRLWFADVQGRLREVSVATDRLDAVLDEGLGIDGGVLGGPTMDETELFLVPDASTFVVMPMGDGAPDVGRMFCDVKTASGTSAPDDTRAVLKAALERAAAQGLTFYVGAEVEHYYLQGTAATPGNAPHPMDSIGRYHPTDGDVVGTLERETLGVMEQLGVGVDWFHHEDAPGQFKVGLQYRDALSMGDGLLTYGQMVRQIARRHDLMATFMPKPFADREGSGVHFTFALMRGDANAFHDPGHPLGLSPTALHFVGGLLNHGPEITLVTNPTVNSYKRLASGFAAPTHCTWANSGRGDMVRIPSLAASDAPPIRLEYRVADPSCNPYLALAALLGAGLDGVEQELQPPPLREPGEPVTARALPTHLADAISNAKDSSLLQDILGEALHKRMLHAASEEWESYHQAVTGWELERYL